MSGNGSLFYATYINDYSWLFECDTFQAHLQHPSHPKNPFGSYDYEQYGFDYGQFNTTKGKTHNKCSKDKACPPGWNSTSLGCLYLETRYCTFGRQEKYKQGCNWFQARLACDKINASLVEITSEEGHEEVLKIIEHKGIKARFYWWVGLRLDEFEEKISSQVMVVCASIDEFQRKRKKACWQNVSCHNLGLPLCMMDTCSHSSHLEESENGMHTNMKDKTTSKITMSSISTSSHSHFSSEMSTQDSRGEDSSHTNSKCTTDTTNTRGVTELKKRRNFEVTRFHLRHKRLDEKKKESLAVTYSSKGSTQLKKDDYGQFFSYNDLNHNFYEAPLEKNSPIIQTTALPTNTFNERLTLPPDYDVINAPPLNNNKFSIMSSDVRMMKMGSISTSPYALNEFKGTTPNSQSVDISLYPEDHGIMEIVNNPKESKFQENSIHIISASRDVSKNTKIELDQNSSNGYKESFEEYESGEPDGNSQTQDSKENGSNNESYDYPSGSLGRDPSHHRYPESSKEYVDPYPSDTKLQSHIEDFPRQSTWGHVQNLLLNSLPEGLDHTPPIKRIDSYEQFTSPIPYTYGLLLSNRTNIYSSHSEKYFLKTTSPYTFGEQSHSSYHHNGHNYYPHSKFPNIPSYSTPTYDSMHHGNFPGSGDSRYQLTPFTPFYSSRGTPNSYFDHSKAHVKYYPSTTVHITQVLRPSYHIPTNTHGPNPKITMGYGYEQYLNPYKRISTYYPLLANSYIESKRVTQSYPVSTNRYGHGKNVYHPDRITNNDNSHQATNSYSKSLPYTESYRHTEAPYPAPSSTYFQNDKITAPYEQLYTPGYYPHGKYNTKAPNNIHPDNIQAYPTKNALYYTSPLYEGVLPQSSPYYYSSTPGSNPHYQRLGHHSTTTISYQRVSFKSNSQKCEGSDGRFYEEGTYIYKRCNKIKCICGHLSKVKCIMKPISYKKCSIGCYVDGSHYRHKEIYKTKCFECPCICRSKHSNCYFYENKCKKTCSSQDASYDEIKHLIHV
ncbi:unnamed protein product [Lepeophtheirus salmonis]|uniref:(salmon louse) hypothetical protein n=1 Tax=Lepeophtheirus salmonis TaxID=72036 RepID=A0A7R8D3G4_LEPSM|nr:unnamed protein product [Lepeophtheirus salmonis]CAF3013561.1 unnamed protein product [Lepeophtheirus salmonis]